jgi:signal transduction histidine kinase/FixJ family two-component response regulator/HPt (histidine-containing phosphotransfer) domain-containing protein
MTVSAHQDTLRRALKAQFGTIVYYRTIQSESETHEELSGDLEMLTDDRESALPRLDYSLIDKRVFPGDAARVRRERDNQLKQSNGFNIQYRLTRPDGSSIWVRDTGTQSLIETGETVREGLLADITTQREMNQRVGRLDQELENSKALLAGISDGNDTHLMVLDGESTIFLVNRSWLEYDASRGLHNSQRQDWVGRNFLELAEQLDDPALGGPDLAQAVRDIRSALRNAAQIAITVPLQWETHYFVITATRLTGEFNGVLLARQNVTDLKRAELAVTEQQTFLHSILDSANHLGVVGINQDQRVALFNPAASTIFGVAQNGVIGRPLEVLQQNLPDGSVWRTHVGTALETRQDAQFESSDFCGTPDRLYENRLTQVKAPEGAPLGTVMLMRDITDERDFAVRMQRINEELEQRVTERTQELEVAKDLAEASSRSKSTFLSNMSHEIRTPMNAVIGMTDLVLETALDQHQLKLLRSVSSSAKSLLGILNDILDVSKLESGKMELEKIPFSISGLIYDIGEMMGHNARRKGLTVDVKLDEQVPTVLLGDPTKLRQVIVNLIGNAIKFTERGSVTLEVKPADEPDHYHFSIIDTGIGIPQAALSKIFERFSQADESTTRRFGGTGLGTAISKGIVEEMGGRIWVESEDGVGSNFQFVVQLPLAVNVDEAQFLADRLRQSGRWTRPLNILYAEDIELNQQLVEMRLSQRKHTVKIAENGRAAVDLYVQGGFDLILMDAHMPVMNGLDAIREIRRIEQETGNHIPIIMLTASVQEEDRALCLAAGADDFAWKPIEFDQLYDKMANFFESFAHAITVTETRNPQLEDLNCQLLDIVKGLEVWGDGDTYRRALLKMGRDYGNVVEQISAFCRDENWSAAKELLHAFKGVTGNLGVKDVPEIANIIENEVKSERTGDKDLMVRFAGKVEILWQDLNLVEHLASPVRSGRSGPDLNLVVPLLDRLAEQLENDEIDDETIDQLRMQLGEDGFAPIETELDSFELARAAQVARNMVSQLRTNGDEQPSLSPNRLPLLQGLLRSLEDSEIDDEALEGLRSELDSQSFTMLEEALDSFDFPEAISLTQQWIAQYESSDE